MKWFFKLIYRLQKYKDLAQTEADIKFIKHRYSEALDCDEETLRKEMAGINSRLTIFRQSENLTDQGKEEMEKLALEYIRISEIVNDSKLWKTQLEKHVKNREDLKEYLRTM